MTEKTEQPTAKKLRKAREEGQVAHSKDVTQIILTVALFGYIMVDASRITSRLGEMMVMPASVLTLDFNAALKVLATQLISDFLILMLPFILIVLVLGFLVEMMQTQGLFSLKAIKPSGKKLNVVQNVQNMFGKKGLIEFFKSCLKIVILLAIVYMILLDELATLLTLPLSDVAGIGLAMGLLFKSLILNLSVAYGAIAAADFFWQRHHHTKQLMMSIDEVRREYKEDEGDPMLKNERKQMHLSMLQEGAVNSARTASVLVTNPVHLAIAVLYRAGVTPLPVVLAKGEGALAARMVAAAREAGVPVMENIPLAWELMRRAPIDQYIPSELFVPMAEVLRMVRDMKREED